MNTGNQNACIMLSIVFKHIFCIPIFAAYFNTSSRLCLRVPPGCVFFPSLSTAISQRRMKESAILLVVAFRSTSWNLRACAPVFFSFLCAPLSAKKKTKRMKQPFGGSGVYPKNASPHFRALCLRRAEVAAQCHASQVGRLSHNFDEVSWSLL